MAEDYVVRGSVAELDPELHRLLRLEDARQQETIILIPSESTACDAVNEALGSSFGNVYAEGYPRAESRRQSEAEILDVETEVAIYRRFSDPRYYKGVEYADVLEALTRRRAAELFAANGVSPDDIYVNVQALSGAPANNAVYSALLKPGETIMGLNLNDGGHLSHGAGVNRSGTVYNGVPYFVDPETEALDYDAIEAQALAVRPQIIVAGFSAYPLIVDWRRFRAIADKVGAYLLADIAHISGLVAAGVHPSPVGIADVITTTTHKSLTGPRGAMIMTHRADLSRKIDRALFPGEQGGPHLNTIAALAVALKLNNSERFRRLQQRIVDNAARLADQLQQRGIRIVGGKSENHLLLLDVKSVGNGEVYPSGDMAARILDVVGIVTNRNTIPGDRSAFAATGVRIGTVWISQLGYGETEIDMLAEAIATALNATTGFFYAAPGGKRRRRAKVDHAALQRARDLVAALTGQIDAPGPAGTPAYLPARAAALPDRDTVEIRGPVATRFVDTAFASETLGLADETSQPSRLLGPDLDLPAHLLRLTAERYQARFDGALAAQQAAEWLRDLSDGYAQFADVYAKAAGPVVVKVITPPAGLTPPDSTPAIAATKPFFVTNGGDLPAGEPLPDFSWTEPADPPLRRTTLYDTHVAAGARMVPFGGYDMPVWYTSVSDEHNAVRSAAGLFDVSHMGVLEADGPYAEAFVNLVTTNDAATLAVGDSQYTYLLDPDGNVIDDLLVYRRGPQRFLLVVNASNNDKDWAWLTAVNEGRVAIDRQRPWVRVQQPCDLRDLRDPAAGQQQRVDIALQGPTSRDTLLALCDDPALAAAIRGLGWGQLTEGNLGGFDVIISRTGYTGERVAYELFVHPDRAADFWAALLTAGEPFGVQPCGLAARDSTRTEAGLPLYGHELAGPFDLSPTEAGFASFIKLWKPFFVGRDACIAHTADRQVVRFRMNDRGVRRPELGDPILDRRGKVVGHVTSCAIDSEGYLLGQAVVPADMAAPETPLLVYQTGGGQRPIRSAAGVDLGARLPVPDGATVLTRFPARKKK